VGRRRAGGGLELALVPHPAKRASANATEGRMAQKATKRAAIEARKHAVKTFALATVAAVRRERGRPSGWTRKADAPELLRAAEFGSAAPPVCSRRVASC